MRRPSHSAAAEALLATAGLALILLRRCSWQAPLGMLLALAAGALLGRVADGGTIALGAFFVITDPASSPADGPRPAGLRHHLRCADGGVWMAEPGICRAGGQHGRALAGRAAALPDLSAAPRQCPRLLAALTLAPLLAGASDIPHAAVLAGGLVIMLALAIGVAARMPSAWPMAWRHAALALVLAMAMAALEHGLRMLAGGLHAHLQLFLPLLVLSCFIMTASAGALERAPQRWRNLLDGCALAAMLIAWGGVRQLLPGALQSLRADALLAASPVAALAALAMLLAAWQALDLRRKPRRERRVRTTDQRPDAMNRAASPPPRA